MIHFNNSISFIHMGRQKKFLFSMAVPLIQTGRGKWPAMKKKQI